MNLYERACKYIGGSETLLEWTVDGIVVDQELAQKRADTCLKCPMNVKDYPIIEVIGLVIKKQLELKNNLKLRVAGEHGLHSCSVCGCPMRTKIWCEIKRIMPTEKERTEFHPNCWILSESADVKL